MSERASTNDSLVRLVSECPKCHKREGRRVAAWRIELYQGQNPERVAETVTCQYCRHQYIVKVSAYLEAG